MKQAEQTDDAGDVAVIGPTIEQTLTRHGVVRIGLLQLLARHAVPQRHGDRSEKALVVLLLVVLRVVDQVDLGILLALASTGSRL